MPGYVSCRVCFDIFAADTPRALISFRHYACRFSRLSQLSLHIADISSCFSFSPFRQTSMMSCCSISFSYFRHAYFRSRCCYFPLISIYFRFSAATPPPPLIHCSSFAAAAAMPLLSADSRASRRISMPDFSSSIFIIFFTNISLHFRVSLQQSSIYFSSSLNRSDTVSFPDCLFSHFSSTDFSRACISLRLLFSLSLVGFSMHHRPLCREGSGMPCLNRQREAFSSFRS